MATQILIFEEQANLDALTTANNYERAVPALAGARYFQIGIENLAVNSQGTELNALITTDPAITPLVFVDFQVHESNGRSRLVLVVATAPAAGTSMLMDRVRFRQWEQIVNQDTQPTAGPTQFLSVEERDEDVQDRLALTDYMDLLVGTAAVPAMSIPGTEMDSAPPAARTLIGARTHTIGGRTRIVTAEWTNDATADLP